MKNYIFLYTTITVYFSSSNQEENPAGTALIVNNLGVFICRV